MVGRLHGERVPAENLKLSPLERIRRHDVKEVFRTRGPESVVLILGDQVVACPRSQYQGL